MFGGLERAVGDRNCDGIETRGYLNRVNQKLDGPCETCRTRPATAVIGGGGPSLRAVCATCHGRSVVRPGAASISDADRVRRLQVLRAQLTPRVVAPQPVYRPPTCDGDRARLLHALQQSIR